MLPPAYGVHPGQFAYDDSDAVRDVVDWAPQQYLEKGKKKNKTPQNTDKKINIFDP